MHTPADSICGLLSTYIHSIQMLYTPIANIVNICSVHSSTRLPTAFPDAGACIKVSVAAFKVLAAAS
jgi:hypothetical protein